MNWLAVYKCVSASRNMKHNQPTTLELYRFAEYIDNQVHV